jgi:cation diffusion facilitator CzcD-associated flavoprotein CzcO
MATSVDFQNGGRALPEQIEVAVIGGGLGGVCLLYRLLSEGFQAILLEAADGLGGTWYHNCYPGARCDIESLDYSYSFSPELQQDWHWTERYAAQPELLRYVNYVADRFELRDHIHLQTRLDRAVFDEGADRWQLSSTKGDFTAKFVVMATGNLSLPQLPDIAGIDSYKGTWYHSGSWPRETVDFTGLDVSVIGTGSSGTQMIPIIAQSARTLTVFQRTANFTMPAQNHPMDPAVEADWKENYPARRKYARSSRFGHNQVANPKNGHEDSPEERQREFERRWELGGMYMLRAYNDFLIDPMVNEEAGEFVRTKIRETVHDPVVAEKLIPRNFYIGTKRLCAGDGYYETYNRDNVTLVDLTSDPIEAIEAAGVRTESQLWESDAIVFATGFDAMTGSLLAVDIRGVGGRSLNEKWSTGPRAYMGLAIAGFPNLFIVTGPGSPSVFASMVTSIEQHVDWIVDCLQSLKQRNANRIEATDAAEEQWVDYVAEIAGKTLYVRSSNSWFFGANTPGKPQVFMPFVGGFAVYDEKTSSVAADDYRGFIIS